VLTFDEDTKFMRELIFSGAQIDRSFSKPILAISKKDLAYPLDFEVGCPHCEQAYKPFGDADDIVLVRTACDKHYMAIFQSTLDDIAFSEAQKMVTARIILNKFDEFCALYPWLIQESFQYNKAFLDWLAMYEGLKREKEVVEKQLEDLKAVRGLPEPVRKENWIQRWFARK
jgi:hypothetical protein